MLPITLQIVMVVGFIALMVFIWRVSKRPRWRVRCVVPLQPEPVYTVECSDGSGDEQVPESKIELILDPHESPTA